MASQTVIMLVGQMASLAGLVVKDAHGNNITAQCTVKLNIVTGTAGGVLISGGPTQGYGAQGITVGQYTVNFTFTNASGSFTSNAAGDANGTDLIEVNPNPPASAAWTWGTPA